MSINLTETLRMYGPVFNLMREAAEEYKIPDTNLTIPKNMKIFIPVHAIHNDPEIYPEPEKFIPERFSEENKRNRHPMAHLPFGNYCLTFLMNFHNASFASHTGDGPRNCIGLRFGLMQTRISLIQLLLNFKFTPSSRTSIPMELHKGSPVLSPLNDMWLKVDKL